MNVREAKLIAIAHADLSSPHLPHYIINVQIASYDRFNVYSKGESGGSILRIGE